jgi:hypothetical protein
MIIEIVIRYEHALYLGKLVLSPRNESSLQGCHACHTMLCFQLFIRCILHRRFRESHTTVPWKTVRNGTTQLGSQRLTLRSRSSSLIQLDAIAVMSLSVTGLTSLLLQSPVMHMLSLGPAGMLGRCAVLHAFMIPHRLPKGPPLSCH